MEDIGIKVRKILVRIVKDEQLNDIISNQENINFVKDLQFDSLNMMELLVEIEEEFNVNFENDIEGINAFTDIRTLTEWLEVHYER